MNVAVRSRMFVPDGGGVVRREHDQKHVQVHDFCLFISECARVVICGFIDLHRAVTAGKLFIFVTIKNQVG